MTSTNCTSTAIAPAIVPTALLRLLTPLLTCIGTIPMPDKTWKQAERRLAKAFGATRNALSGSNSKLSASDSTHPRLYLEAKQRESHAVWTLYQDSKVKAKKEGKTPIIGLFKNRSPGVLLCIHSDDLPTLVEEWLIANDKSHLLVFLTTAPFPSASPPEGKDIRSVHLLTQKTRKRKTKPIAP